MINLVIKTYFESHFVAVVMVLVVLGWTVICDVVWVMAWDWYVVVRVDYQLSELCELCEGRRAVERVESLFLHEGWVALVVCVEMGM